jgi:hypothetical protein
MVGFLVSLCFSLVTNYTLGSNYFVTTVTKPRHPDQPQTKATPNNGNNVTATAMGQERHMMNWRRRRRRRRATKKTRKTAQETSRTPLGL